MDAIGRLAVPSLLVILAGCASPASVSAARQGPALQWISPTKAISLRVDHVVLYERSDLEPGYLAGYPVFKQRSDWSERARSFVVATLTDDLSRRGIQAKISYEPEELEDHAVPPELTDRADYVLQISASDWYRNASSKAVTVAAGIWTLGVLPLITAFPPEPGSHLAQYEPRAEISLLNVHTGKLVWSKEIKNSFGDLTTEPAVKRMIAQLLSGAPL